METLERHSNARLAAFLESTGMPPTMFGMRAVGDRNLMRQIAEGHSLSLRMVDRILGVHRQLRRGLGRRTRSTAPPAAPLVESSRSTNERGWSVLRPNDPSGKGRQAMRTKPTKMGAVTWAALWLLTPARLHAQGTSPWVDAVTELQTQFTGPIARGLSLIAIVVGGLMFAFGGGGSKRTLAGIILRDRDGRGRGELPGLALLMRGLTRWAGYAALNRPLPVLGVARRLFLLGATLAVAMGLLITYMRADRALVTGGDR